MIYCDNNVDQSVSNRFCVEHILEIIIFILFEYCKPKKISGNKNWDELNGLLQCNRSINRLIKPLVIKYKTHWLCKVLKWKTEKQKLVQRIILDSQNVYDKITILPNLKKLILYHTVSDQWNNTVPMDLPMNLPLSLTSLTLG